MNRTINDLEFLKGSELTPGHCVILNDVECPSAQMLCVIVAKTDNGIACKYLINDKRFTEYNELNNRSGMILTDLKYTTPVEHFGVRICLDPAKNVYWSEILGESQAKYPDGSPRMWQERYPIRYKARKDLLQIALRSEVS
jgi:hypothetical protein